MNVVVLFGTLSRDPERRFLPSGDEVMSLDVTTRVEGEPAASVPVAWFAPPASTPALTHGQAVVVTGRVRRRFYRTGAGVQSRTEVVADRVVPERQTARARAAVAAAMASIEAPIGGERVA